MSLAIMSDRLKNGFAVTHLMVERAALALVVAENVRRHTSVFPIEMVTGGIVVARIRPEGFARVALCRMERVAGW